MHRREQHGAALVEFAVVLPLLCLLLLGIARFGLALNNYLVLTDAVRVGGRNLALSRGATTPYDTTMSKIFGSAPNLASGGLAVTLAVNGTSCSSNQTCKAALAAGADASVVAIYPCNLQIMGITIVPNCFMTSRTTERVE